MPPRATRTDGAGHPGADAKSPSLGGWLLFDRAAIRRILFQGIVMEVLQRQAYGFRNLKNYRLRLRVMCC